MVSDVLKQSFMDSKLSCTSPLPWIWVFEILTRSKQIDISVLLELVKKTPKISEDIGRNASELVSLRILESICSQRARLNSVSCTSSPKIRIDPSERCEDVLRRTLGETSATDLESIGAKMLQWDIQAFIEHKRSCLPKCSLQKLKTATLTGSYPPFSALKKTSGLRVGNQPENKAPAVDGDCNGNKPRVEGTNTNTQICPENDQLISPALANGSYLFSGNLAEENLLPAERKRTAPTENAGRKSCEEQIMREDGRIACIKAVKKHKPGIISGEQDLGAKLISLDVDRQTTDAFMTILQCTEDETNILENETHVGGMGLERPPSNDVCTSSKHGGLHGVLPCERRSPCGDTEALVDKANQEYGQDHNIEEQGQDHDIEDAECDKEGLHQCNIANGNMNKLDQVIQRNLPDGSGVEVDISGDSDLFHNEMSDIAAKKNAFLSSQCTLSQDSLVSDWKEHNLCMKCNKGGILLVCCSKSCPLVIHDSCLVCDASFDTEGNFYCPFCAYSQAISKYLETKEKASLARKDLTTFISLGTRKETEKRPQRSCGIKRNHLGQDDGLPKINEDFKQDDGLPKCNEDFEQGDGLPRSNEDTKQDDVLPKSNEDFEQGEDLPQSNELNNINFVKKVSICKRRKKLEGEQAGPSVLVSGHSPLFGQNFVASGEVIPHTFKKEKQAEKRKRQVPRSVKVNGKHQMGEKVSCQVRERGDGDAEIRYKEGGLGPSETDRVRGYKGSPSFESAGTEEISEEESENSGASKYFIRVRKQEKQRSYPAIPQSRRKTRPWTSAEEEKLKEGMQKLYSPRDKKLPWKKILEFGAGTFDGSRTTIDLKDKWRNICRAASKSE